MEEPKKDVHYSKDLPSKFTKLSAEKEEKCKAMVRTVIRRG
jgi:hypothetical protein